MAANGGSSLRAWLQFLRIDKYHDHLQSMGQNARSLAQMDDAALAALGLPLGPRKKIRLNAGLILQSCASGDRQHQQAQQQQGRSQLQDDSPPPPAEPAVGSLPGTSASALSCERWMGALTAAGPPQPPSRKPPLETSGAAATAVQTSPQQQQQQRTGLLADTDGRPVTMASHTHAHQHQQPCRGMAPLALPRPLVSKGPRPALAPAVAATRSNGLPHALRLASTDASSPAALAAASKGSTQPSAEHARPCMDNTRVQPLAQQGAGPSCSVWGGAAAGAPLAAGLPPHAQLGHRYPSSSAPPCEGADGSCPLVVTETGPATVASATPHPSGSYAAAGITGTGPGPGWASAGGEVPASGSVLAERQALAKLYPVNGAHSSHQSELAFRHIMAGAGGGCGAPAQRSSMAAAGRAISSGGGALLPGVLPSALLQGSCGRIGAVLKRCRSLDGSMTYAEGGVGTQGGGRGGRPDACREGGMRPGRSLYAVAASASPVDVSFTALKSEAATSALELRMQQQRQQAVTEGMVEARRGGGSSGELIRAGGHAAPAGRDAATTAVGLCQRTAPGVGTRTGTVHTGSGGGTDANGAGTSLLDDPRNFGTPELLAQLLYEGGAEAEAAAATLAPPVGSPGVGRAEQGEGTGGAEPGIEAGMVAREQRHARLRALREEVAATERLLETLRRMVADEERALAAAPAGGRAGARVPVAAVGVAPVATAALPGHLQGTGRTAGSGGGVGGGGTSGGSRGNYREFPLDTEHIEGDWLAEGEWEEAPTQLWESGMLLAARLELLG